MKIAFFISTVRKENNGIGGHYFSLINIANEISKKHEVYIINIGIKESLALKHSELPIINIIGNSLLPFFRFKKLKKIIAEKKIEILHAFDIQSFFWARILANQLKIPIILNKCGGPNPENYYPYTKNLIVFSKENYDFFTSNEKYANSNISLIPNRVIPFQTDRFRMESLKNKYNLYRYEFILLRITRLGSYYQECNIQLINLFKRLKADGINVCLLFVGTLEDNNIKKEYLNVDQDIFIESENEFTNNAKELIGIADCVLGTGRSFMEAANQGKIMLAPCKNSPIPLLVTETNFDSFLNTNFSERYYNANINIEENYNKLKDLIYNPQLKKNYETFIINKFETHFNLKNAISKYENIYKTISFEPESYYGDLIKNFYQYWKFEVKELLNKIYKIKNDKNNIRN